MLEYRCSTVQLPSVCTFSLRLLPHPLAQQGSTTHTVNTDQRRIPLNSTSSSGTTYYFTLPGDPGIIMPGLWWIFAIDPDGVPSVGYQIQVTSQHTWRRSEPNECLVQTLDLRRPQHLISFAIKGMDYSKSWRHVWWRRTAWPPSSSSSIPLTRAMRCLRQTTCVCSVWSYLHHCCLFLLRMPDPSSSVLPTGPAPVHFCPHSNAAVASKPPAAQAAIAAAPTPATAVASTAAAATAPRHRCPRPRRRRRGRPPCPRHLRRRPDPLPRRPGLPLHRGRLRPRRRLRRRPSRPPLRHGLHRRRGRRRCRLGLPRFPPPPRSPPSPPSPPPLAPG